MKRIIILCFTVFLLASFTSYNNKPCPLFSKDEIEVIFNHQLKFDDLVKIKTDLSHKEIVISYKTIEFDENGKLVAISFSVTSEGRYCGKGSSKILKDNSRFGFIIDKSKDAPVYFRVGSI